MHGTRAGAALRLVGVGALVAGIALAGSGAAFAQDDGSPLIEADVVADIVVEGGDAQGGDAVGGNAGMSASVAGTGDAGGGQGDVAVNQDAGNLEGGNAVGGDAVGGDGLNAFVDAVVILDADVALDVAADVAVDTTVDANANADVSAPDAGLGGAVDSLGGALGEVTSAAQGVDPAGFTGAAGTDAVDTSGLGTGTLDTPGVPGTAGSLGLGNAVGDATGSGSGSGSEGGSLGGVPSLGGVLGGLGGLNLLDLNADLEVGVTGGDAEGGTAVGGGAVLEAAVAGTPNGSVSIDQSTGNAVGGDASGGAATGGDGIELDVILDADIDLIVDANVDLAADVVTDLNLDADVRADGNGGGGGGNGGGGGTTRQQAVGFAVPEVGTATGEEQAASEALSPASLSRFETLE